MSNQKRYRVLVRVPQDPNSVSNHDRCFRPHGHGSELADGAEDAVRRVATRTDTPTDGTWLVLCESDGRWYEFTVRRETQLVIGLGSPQEAAAA